ncbi:MAG: Na+/H+ antiporter subunit G [Sedimentisphaerales bacterium]|nr:Na+/H+ antiporter subunit G [Sedimentisphaerales bacterium]
MNETLGMILIGIGLAFDLIGTVGLVRFPDMYNRLQAATKCVTLGTATLLIGVAVYSGVSALAAKALLGAVFILLTSPVGAHAIARGAHHSGVRLWEGSVQDAYQTERQKQEYQHAKTETA